MLLATLFFLADSYRMQRNEEKTMRESRESAIYPNSTLEGKIFFDSNNNYRLDASDIPMTGPVKLSLIQSFPESDEIYNIVSENGRYIFTAPRNADIIRISLNGSAEELNNLTDPADQSADFRIFRFSLINGSEQVGSFWQSDGSTIWFPEGKSVMNILIIGIK
jgi:hypothetical protein